MYGANSATRPTTGGSLLGSASRVLASYIQLYPVTFRNLTLCGCEFLVQGYKHEQRVMRSKVPSVVAVIPAHKPHKASQGKSRNVGSRLLVLHRVQSGAGLQVSKVRALAPRRRYYLSTL